MDNSDEHRRPYRRTRKRKIQQDDDILPSKQKRSRKKLAQEKLPSWKRDMAAISQLLDDDDDSCSSSNNNDNIPHTTYQDEEIEDSSPQNTDDEDNSRFQSAREKKETKSSNKRKQPRPPHAKVEDTIAAEQSANQTDPPAFFFNEEDEDEDAPPPLPAIPLLQLYNTTTAAADAENNVGDDCYLDEVVAESLYPNPRFAPVRKRKKPPATLQKNYQKRIRWKKRKVDLRQEQDCGDAVYRQVREQLLRQERQERRKRKAAAQAATVAEETKAAEQENEEVDTHNGNTSIYEKEEEETPLTSKSSILNQLLQGSQAKESDKAETGPDPQTAQSTDWWDTGYSIPHNTQNVAFPPPVFETIRRKNDTILDDEQLAMVPLRVAHSHRTHPRPFRHQCFSFHPLIDPSMLHCRRLAALISRMVGAGFNRHIELLWKLHNPLAQAAYSLRPARWSTPTLVEEWSLRYGHHMLLFYQTEWHDRTLAAQQLALLSPEKQGRSNKPGYVYISKAMVRNSVRTPGTNKETLPSLTTTRYIHLPATQPPIPSFPLDITDIIWGPKARFHDVQHSYTHKIGLVEELVYKVTVAALLAQDDWEQARKIVEHTMQTNEVYWLAHSDLERPSHCMAQVVAYAAALEEEPYHVLGEILAMHRLFLDMFRPLHLSLALMHITDMVKDEDIKQWMRREGNDTSPVDFMRTLLEIEIDYTGCDRVALDYALNKHASDLTSVKRNPTDARWYVWRVAFLAGSLFLSGDGENPLCTTETARGQLAEAFLLLVRLSHQHQPACGILHQAIKALLEWSVVAALLFGNHVEYEDIQLLHQYHERKWKTITMTDDTIEQVDSPIEQALLRLEKNPDKRMSWITLVKRLGPLGRQQPLACNNCAGGCRFLCERLHLSRMQDGCWIGRDWWYESVLIPLCPQPDLALVDDEDKIASAIDKVQKEVTPTPATNEDQNDGMALETPSLEWLNLFVFGIRKTECVGGDDLMIAIENMPKARFGCNVHLQQEQLLLEDVDDHLAVLTCKLIISAHRGQLGSEAVGMMLLEIIRCGWQDSTINLQCMECIKCLVTHGIHVERLFRQAIKHYWNRYLAKGWSK